MKRQASNGRGVAGRHADVPLEDSQAGRRGSVAKVSHTLDVTLAEKLEEFAFRQRFSESAVIEFALNRFFESGDDQKLGDVLRASGAGRRRKV